MGSCEKDAQNVADLEAKLKNVPEKTLTSGEEFERLEGAKNSEMQSLNVW